MSSRFWVAGSGNWDGSDTTHWSASSGGAGGASVPTSSDDVFFDANSGLNTCTISAGTRSAKTLTCTGYGGVLTGTGTGSVLNVFGNVTLAATMASTLDFLLQIVASCSYTSAGQSPTQVQLNGGSITVTAADAFFAVVLAIARGTFDANNKNVTLGSFAGSGNQARGLTMGSGTWVLTGTGTVWDLLDVTNLTFNANTSTIKLTDASSATKTFVGGGKTYNTIWASGAGTGLIIITLATFTLKDDGGVAHITQLGLGASGVATLAAPLSGPIALLLTTGTFNANGQAVTLLSFSAAVGAVALSMGAATWTLTGTGVVWDLSAAATVVFTPSTSTIKINDATAASKTFKGGSKTYNALWLTGAGTGAFIITGSNTFATFTLDTPPHTVQFEAGSTQTVTTISFSGSAAGSNTLEGVGGGIWDITSIAGVSASYLNLQGSHAHGGAFVAANSFDGGDNLHWSFIRSQSDVIYFDSAYQYSGAAVSVISGLNWLIGETLGVDADGEDIGDATVTSAGNLTLPDGVSASNITVGKRYLSRAVTLRAPQTGNADGSALGRRMKINTVQADILDTGWLDAGSLVGVERLPPAHRRTNEGDLYTGIYEIPIDDSHLNEGVVAFETDRGYPATVRAIQFEITGEP